jgi:hypothetical protein
MSSYCLPKLSANLLRLSPKPSRLRIVGALACLALPCLFTPTAHATLLWQSNTSLGTSVFAGLEEAPGTVSIASDPLGQFGNVYHYQTYDDTSYAKERCESRGTELPNGTTFLPSINTAYYLGWREMWNPMPTQGDWVALFQMHGYGPAGQGAPLVLRCVNGDGNLYMQNNVNGTNINFWHVPFHTGVWQTFVLHIYLSTSATVGYVELWYNGVPQTFINGLTRYYCPLWDSKTGSYVQFKWGVYRSGTVNGKGPASTYMTDAKLGTTYADVDPLGGGSTQAAAPTFSPGGGTYTSSQSVTITSATSGALIRYTTDGSTPSETAGTLYSGTAVSIGSTTTLNAIAYETGFTDSAVTSGTYTISTGGGSTPITLEAEDLSPVGTGATVSISDDANASGGVVEFLNSTGVGQTMTLTTPSIAAGTYQIQLRYWTNTTRGQHTLKIDGVQLGGTLDQYATTKAYLTSTFGTVTFASTGTHSIVLTVTGKNAAATQYYITADSFILTPESSEQPVAAPAFSPAGGTYTSAQTVSISSATSGASFRYTTDGSTPSETAGTIYSGAVPISSTTTLKAIGYESGFTVSPVTSATYTFGSPPTLNFEAESLSPVGTGATVSISDDANASGGVVEFLNSTAAGQIMTFTTPSIPAGTYQVQLRYWTNKTRGQHTLKIDGTQLGGTLDQYATTQAYLTSTFGTVTFSSAGTHSIAMTVTGKDSAATQFYITADKFTFVGQ